MKWSFDRFLDANHPFYNPPYNLLSYYLGGPDLDYGIETVEVMTLGLTFTLKKPDPTFADDQRLCGGRLADGAQGRRQ